MADFERIQISGAGIIFEIAATKLDYRKIISSHQVDRVLVIDGVERATERIFLCELPEKALEIKHLIEYYVLPESII